MSNNPNQPQNDHTLLGEQSPSLTFIYHCCVCQTEYTSSGVNRCAICNWDLTPCPEAFVERHNDQLAWAREMWVNLQTQEKQLHISQSQVEDVKQEKAQFEGEILYRLEQLEQVQNNPIDAIYGRMQQLNADKAVEVEKQLSDTKEHLKEATYERKKLTVDVEQLSSQMKKFIIEQQKKNDTELQLVSEFGIDYSRLRNLLIAGKWQEANQETGEIIENIDHRLERASCSIKNLLAWEDSFRPYNCTEEISRIEKIPYQDIIIIDKLWEQNSYGRFGFSVQKQLYELCDNDYSLLIQAVKWASNENDDYFFKNMSYNNQLFDSFSINAPPGHLPNLFVYNLNTVDSCNWKNLPGHLLFHSLMNKLNSSNRNKLDAENLYTDNLDLRITYYYDHHEYYDDHGNQLFDRGDLLY